MPRIQVYNRTVKLWASASDTYNWAHRPGSSWPGSQLSDSRLFAEFARGDLVDYAINGRSADIDLSEFNAFTSDMLATKLDPSHPDYDALVTRFQAEGFVKPTPRVKRALRKSRKRVSKANTSIRTMR